MTRPLTILVDLRATQFNGDRGIPAYCQSLALELCRRHPAHRWLLWHDDARPAPPRADELAVHGVWHTSRSLAAPEAAPIDAVLTGCFFMPHHTCGADYLLPRWLLRQRPRRLGIVYDLVPLLFPEQYLARERARQQYREALGLLRGSDRLFGISQATCRDTVRHVGFDPARIDCIYGDIDHRKRELMAAPAADTAAVPARHGLTGRYSVCVGGDDWRKNLDTTVRAFAAFHRRHPDHRLAIVCKLSERRIAELGAIAAAEGLPAQAVVCTGYVSDADLVGLMQHAAFMVYASLYEGLGLPVLEAYGCGVPVVGSATSSVGELVIPELAFEPTDPAAIAATMERLVATPALAAASLDFGRGLLASLGWRQAAAQVMERLEARPERQQGTGPRRLAVVAALPPVRTAIAGYTVRHLQPEAWRTDLFDANPGPTVAAPAGLRPTSRVLPVEVLRPALDRGRHGAVIHVLGNSPHHAKVLEAMMQSRHSGGRRLVYLHEAILTAAFRHWLGDDYRLLPAAASTPSSPWTRRVLAANPDIGRCLRYLVERAGLDGAIVNSAACRALVRDAVGTLGDRWTIDVAFHPVVPPTVATPLSPRAGDGVLRIGTFGIGGDGKRLDCVARSVAVISRRRPARLVIAGWDVSTYCRRTGIASLPHVEVCDAPDDAGMRDLMAAVDVAVQLRDTTHGESSGAVAQLLAVGTPLVVTNEGSFAELPHELATFVPVDCTPDVLATAIEAAAERRVAAPDLAHVLAGLSPEAFHRRLEAILAAA
jgi:glycosyltransferase involved in cell wall biosynthesis